MSDSTRTCIGCRRRASKTALLRLVVVDGVPVVDERQRLPGRGAYLCRRKRCFIRADRRGALLRAFRRKVRPGASLPDVWRDQYVGPGSAAGMNGAVEGVRPR